MHTEEGGHPGILGEIFFSWTILEVMCSGGYSITESELLVHFLVSALHTLSPLPSPPLHSPINFMVANKKMA